MTAIRTPKTFFGITGGIASGKSSISRRFRERGVPVIDADCVSREVVRVDSPGYVKVVEAFGPGILDPDRELNRKALADIVFSDPNKLKVLEEILDPEVALLTTFHAYDFTRSEWGSHEVVGFESALIVDREWIPFYKPLIVVLADEQTQIERGMSRTNTTADKVRARMARQVSTAERLQHADYVIENNGSLAELNAKADEVLNQILMSQYRMV